MATVVLHAGMGKAGSTSIQEWLRRHSAHLRSEAGITPLIVEADADGSVRAVPHTSGSTNSVWVMARVRERPEDGARILDHFVDALARAADEHGTVVVSSETFARPIAYGDVELVGRLDRLARRCEVRVAYYARPQHLALESGWRHWRSDRETVPLAFIERINRELDHHATLRFVQGSAPDLRFTMRPFRADLLQGGDVVVDFASEFLGLAEDASMLGIRENAGIPLDLASTLTALPTPHPWPPHRDPEILDVVREILGDGTGEISARAVLARLVLQQACHEHFEPGNRCLIEALGWETDAFVPALADDVRAGIGPVGFDRLDELWQPDANPAELDLLQRAIADLVATRDELHALRSRRAVRAALAATRILRR